MINRHLAKFLAFSVQVGKAFIHPEKVDKHQQISGIIFGTQTVPFIYCLTYAEELGDIKMLGQGGLKSCLP
jgi:hypothetical protein